MATVVSTSTVTVLNNQSQFPTNGLTITGTTAGNALLIIFSGNQYAQVASPLVTGFSASAGSAPTLIYQQQRGYVADAWVGAAIVPSGPGGTVTFLPQYATNNAYNNMTGFIVQLSGLGTSPIDTGSIAGNGSPDPQTTVSVGPTATLAQADSFIVGICSAQYGGAAANITNTVGGLTLLAQMQDGTQGNTLWAGYKNVSSTAAQSLTFTHASATYGDMALVFALKNGTAAAQRFKFLTDPSAINASGCSAVVWDTSAGIVGNKIQEYTGLSFQPTGQSGQAVIYADATGKGYTNGTSVKGIVFNSTNTTGIISGTVEAGSA